MESSNGQTLRRLLIDWAMPLSCGEKPGPYETLALIGKDGMTRETRGSGWL